MPRKVKPNLNVQTEPLTKNLEFDDVICHSETPRKYFTPENNDIIYAKMREMNVMYPPYLGPCVDFGLGDACLEESGDKFKFYYVERMHKYKCADFNNIKDAIEHLVKIYSEKRYVQDPDAFRKIFYDTLNL